MRYFLLLFSLLFCWVDAADKPYVLVSVSPHKFFVERIAGSTLDVGLMVPAGASAHTFEPTPKQILQAGRALLWFRVGEPFEDRAICSLKSYKPELIVVDMREGITLIPSQCRHAGCSHRHGEDLHFWLSARMAKIQADTITKALSHSFPEYKDLFQKNLLAFHQELTQLDDEITAILKPMKSRNIMVSHPAYAYFCRDYDINQYSIEFEGKDPTPHQLTKTLNLTRDLHIRTIYIQMQYNNKGARLIAEEIKAKVVTLDPYAEQFMKSMRDIAHAFAEGA